MFVLSSNPDSGKYTLAAIADAVSTGAGNAHAHLQLTLHR